MTLEEIFAGTSTPPDIEYRGAAADSKFLFTHRSAADAEIYFVSNQNDRAEHVDCAFRIEGRQPVRWDAVTSERCLLTEWSEQSGQTVVPLTFAPQQSWFVVFRHRGQPVAGAPKNFPDLKPLTTLASPWEVTFDPRWGGPARADFPRLVDLITRPEEGIKHYSGAATYRTTFELSTATLNATSTGLFLDLGEVRDLATVRLNGRELGTLWTAPWRVNIAAAARMGANTLEIAVVNPWNNRLVGDHPLLTEKRLTSLSLSTLKPNAPLQPAGLLGPVTLRSPAAGSP